MGIDTEKKILADSLDFGRYLFNPFCYLYQRLGDIDTTKDSYAVLNDSLVRYNEAGWKRYEFSNHLGNILAVTSDRKIATDTLSGAGSGADYYYADLFSVNDYDPFGMVQPGRSWKRKEKARFGFNGKENEEWDVQDYGFRISDPKTGRFVSVDPLTDDYPWYTPYQFAGNTPIQAIDLDGLEPKGVGKEGDTQQALDQNNPGAGTSNFSYLDGKWEKCHNDVVVWADNPHSQLERVKLLNDEGTLKSSQIPSYEQIPNLTDGLPQRPPDQLIDLSPKVTLEDKWNMWTAVISGGRGGGYRPSATIGMSNRQLVFRAGVKAFNAIPGKGPEIGTRRHQYARDLLVRYQEIYGDRGLRFDVRGYKEGFGTGILDVLDTQNETIYDFKFGKARLSNKQRTKYEGIWDNHQVIPVYVPGRDNTRLRLGNN